MNYEIRIQFNTSLTLTEKEMGQLIATIHAQIAEPADEFGDDAEYSTEDIRIESKGDLI